MIDGDSATQSANDTGETTGGAAPKDAAAARTFSQDEVNAFLAKERRRSGEAASQKARTDLLASLGITDAEELSELVEAGRKVRPNKLNEAERQAEKARQVADQERAALQQQLAALQAERDAALLRDAVRAAIGKLNVIEGADDLILGVLGIGSPQERRPTVKDGKVAVVDQDGDPVSSTVEQYLAEFVKARPYLQSPTVQPTTRRVQAQNEPKPPPRKMTRQEERDEIVRIGMAHSANGRQQ